VLVGAWLVVPEHAPVAPHERRTRESVAGLFEAVAERRRSDTGARDADRRVAAEVRMDASQLVENARRACRAYRNERPQRLVAAVDEGRARERGDAAFERVVHAHRGENEVRHLEVAAESPRAALRRLA